MKEVPPGQDVSVESLLGQAADEFTARCSRGEQPDIEEYAARYPQIAAIVREVFPALQATPAGAAPLDAADELPPGELPAAAVLGDYRLIREIGRGGMGVVYQAEQISLCRSVALKVLSFAAVLDSRRLQRFKNEAHAAAQLHHTNIVPVFAVGCERGVHYYAMQFIEGQPLSAVVRELRRLAGLDVPERPVWSGSVSDATERTASACSGPADEVSSGLSAAAGQLAARSTSGLLGTVNSENTARGRSYFRSVVNLAVQAAEALQYAHERGVIHRDVKPSNLLLDTDGRLWVTDFGLAIMQTDPGLTLTGDLLGTIRYMSPEQAQAKRVPIDHRTDIYSLGVTLYELLTLTPAFPSSDRHMLLRQIASEEPRPLRRLDPTIPGELETIVGKAIAKNPGDRYGTAQELADDLRRFLEDKPILAKPPGLLERAAKWSRRHRSLVATAVVLLIMSVAGLSVSTILIARERANAMREREKAMRERDAAREQRQLAEVNLEIAQQVVDRMLTDGAAAESADPPNAEKLQLTLQQESLAVAKALADRSPEPAARWHLATTYVQLAQTYAQLGQYEPAEQAYRDAAGIFKKLRTEAPGVIEYTTELVQADLRLSTLLWQKRRYTEAETYARQANTLAAAMVNELPDSQPYRLQLAATLDLLGRVMRDTSRFAEAETFLRRSINLRRAIARVSSQSLQRRQQSLELARTQRNLADLLLKAGRREEAEAVCRDSIVTLEQLTNWFPDIDLYAKELARSRRWWDEALRLADQQAALAGPGSGTQAKPESGYKQMLAGAHRILNDAIQGEGDPEEANAAYLHAVGVVEQMAGQFPTDVQYREALFDLHRAEAARTRELWLLDESEAAYRKAVEILEQLLAEYPNKAGYLEQLGRMRTKVDLIRGRRPIGGLMLLSKGSPEEIASAVELARNVDLALISTNPPVLTICADHLALGGDYARAEALARKATELDPEDIAAWKSLGWALQGLGRRDEGQAAFRHALAVLHIRTGEEAVGACPEPSTMAYLLDMVSQDRFVSRWQGVKMWGSRFDPWPWFWVGVRMELEGRLPEAESAYRTCAGLGSLPKAHYTAKWAAYRLQNLGGAPPPTPWWRSAETNPRP